MSKATPFWGGLLIFFIALAFYRLANSDLYTNLFTLIGVLLIVPPIVFFVWRTTKRMEKRLVESRKTFPLSYLIASSSFAGALILTADKEFIKLWAENDGKLKELYSERKDALRLENATVSLSPVVKRQGLYLFKKDSPLEGFAFAILKDKLSITFPTLKDDELKRVKQAITGVDETTKTS